MHTEAALLRLHRNANVRVNMQISVQFTSYLASSVACVPFFPSTPHTPSLSAVCCVRAKQWERHKKQHLISARTDTHDTLALADSEDLRRPYANLRTPQSLSSSSSCATAPQQRRYLIANSRAMCSSKRYTMRTHRGHGHTTPYTQVHDSDCAQTIAGKQTRRDIRLLSPWRARAHKQRRSL